ncbi:hypothetical protein U1Q18_018359 [Sarracenia purpurea var. burkii]
MDLNRRFGLTIKACSAPILVEDRRFSVIQPKEAEIWEKSLAASEGASLKARWASELQVNASGRDLQQVVNGI